MAFQFPSNPSPGDTYDKYSWNGSEWILTDQGGGGGGGIEEAPIDGQQYARQNAAWSVISATGGIEEAPQDNRFYVRINGTWTDLAAALFELDNQVIDGGDFLTGLSQGDNEIISGGNFTTGVPFEV